MNDIETTPGTASIAGAGALVLYDKACRALAEANAVDEVKDTHDIAVAIRLYARQAVNKDLEADATELRQRAVRRLGEMIELQKEKVGLNEGGRPSKTGFSKNPVSKLPTLAETGINKNLANQARKMSALPPAAFEAMVADSREPVLRPAERRTIKDFEIEQTRAAYKARAELGGHIDDLRVSPSESTARIDQGRCGSTSAIPQASLCGGSAVWNR